MLVAAAVAPRARPRPSRGDLLPAARGRWSRRGRPGATGLGRRRTDGQAVRINDVVAAHAPRVPAQPAALTRSTSPRRARLTLACGIAARPPGPRPASSSWSRSGATGARTTVWTQLLDPVRAPAHRRWVPADVDLARFAGQGVSSCSRRAATSRTPTTRGGPSGPRPRSPCRTATRRSPSSTWWTRCAPTTPALRLRPRHHARAGRVRRRRRGLRAGRRHASWTKPSVASLLHLAAARPAPGGPAPRQLDPGHVTLAEMLQAKGFATGAAIANSVIYCAGHELRAGLRLLRRPARRRRPPLEGGGGGGRGGRRARASSTSGAASHLPLRAHHGPARALHAARRPSTACSSPARAAGAPPPIRAPTTRSRRTASASSTSTTARSRTATASSAASCAS